MSIGTLGSAAETEQLPVSAAEPRRPVRPPGRARPVRRTVAGWPLIVLLGGFPLWWVTGVISLITMACAVPMAIELVRRRPLRLPAGFVFWLLLLVWVVLSAGMLTQQAPDTQHLSLDGGTLLGLALRFGNYLSVTIVMLYIGNLRRDELPVSRVVKLLAWVFAVTVAGGLLGLLLPQLTFQSPLSYLLPRSLTSHGFVERLMTVTTAQQQDIFGDTRSVRPSAPYEFTNTWGYAYNLLLPAFVVATLLARKRRMRVVGVVVLLLSMLPVVFSLNRGLWIGLALSFGIFLGHRIRTGGLLAATALSAAAAVALMGVLLSPLGETVVQRLQTGHSDETRRTLNQAALNAALSSPLLGYGGNRETIGSGQSIAIGPTAACPQCGSRLIGSDGHFWLLLLQQGFPGVAFYMLFHGTVLWRYRRDMAAVGLMGTLMVAMPMFYMLVYPALGPPMLFTMIGVAVLWRRHEARVGRERMLARLRLGLASEPAARA